MRAAALLAAPLSLLVAALLAPRRSLVRESGFTPAELALHAANHTFLHIGGQHRGGTTLLWRALSSHSSISAHYGGGRAEPAELGAELSARELNGEGIFLQDVYPRFSLDHPPHFFVRKRLRHIGCGAVRVLRRAPRAEEPAWLSDWCRGLEGIGSYALSPLAALQPSADERANRRAALTLLSQWASHWGAEGLERPWLLEKSPSNALIAPWLSAVWGSVSAPAKWVFITRHPLAQCLAMASFVDDLDTRQLLEHWLAVEEASRRAARALPPGSVLLTSLERLAAHPAATVRSVLCWAGGGGGSSKRAPALAPECSLEPAWRETDAARSWLDAVRPRPNERYAARYRANLERRESAPDAARRALAGHRDLVREFETRVASLSGYSLGVAAAETAREEEALYGGFGRPPARDSAWLERWLGAPNRGRVELV